MPIAVTVKVYRPVMIYGAEAWTLRIEEGLLERTEMRMLRSMRCLIGYSVLLLTG